MNTSSVDATTPNSANQDPFGLFTEPETKPTSQSTEVVPIGLASFDDKYDMKLAQQWKDLEEEMYECVNITPVPPFFRTHVHCLSCHTKNNLQPYCVINGEYSIYTKSIYREIVLCSGLSSLVVGTQCHMYARLVR